MINPENRVQEEREKEENLSNEKPQKNTTRANFSLTKELACLAVSPNEAPSLSIYTLYKK